MSGNHPHLVRYPNTILGADQVDDLDKLSADVTFFGVPWEGGLRPGASPGQRFGPQALRRNNLSDGSVADARFIDLETGQERLSGMTMADIGDLDLLPALGAEENFRRITEVSKIVASKGGLPIAVGGDHSLSFPVGRGAFSHLDEVDIVHFDAHSDFHDEIGGSKFTHGSNLRRLSELPNVRHISALGLRYVGRRTYDAMLEYGVDIASVRQMTLESPAETVRRVVPKAKNIYVSIDIDVLDAPLVPGTCVPEPGGLQYNQLIEALGEVAKRGRIVGIDIVEINPMNDTGKGYLMAARTSSWILFEFLSAIRESRR